jgi:signal transduction histidine kinase
MPDLDRLHMLTSLLRELSSDMDPVQSINLYWRRLRALYHAEGFMSISTREAPPGHYRVVRLHHQDEVKKAGLGDLEFAGDDAPVHSGGLIGSVITRGEVLVTRELNLPEDPVLGQALAPYRMAMFFPVFFMGEAKNWVAFFHIDTAAFTQYEIEMKLLQANMMGGMTSAKAMLKELQASQESLNAALTELKAVQNRLVVQEKMAALGRLTGGIAHEIKNPLNFVTNFAELSFELVDEIAGLCHLMDGAGSLQDEAGAVLADLRGNLERIQSHGKRAAAIVESMLAHSRGRPGKFQRTDLNALVAEYSDFAFHGMRAQHAAFACHIEKHLDPGLPEVAVDAQSMARAVLNIVNNALFAAAEKCKQRLPGYQPLVRVSTKHVDGHVVISVWDNGIGIPAAFLDQIYEPFFTMKTAQSGTGLGLSLAHDIIVQQHNDTINATSTEGEYTQFVVTLPVR